MTVENPRHLRIMVGRPYRLYRSLAEVEIAVAQHTDARAEFVASCGEQPDGPRSDFGADRDYAQRVDKGLPIVVVSALGPTELTDDEPRR